MIITFCSTQNCPRSSSKTAFAKSIVTSAWAAAMTRDRESRSFILVMEIFLKKEILVTRMKVGNR